MKIKFIIGVIISVVLIVGNQLLIQRALRMKKNDSRLINLSGKQRMLSQKIELEFYKLAQNKSDIRILENSFEEWKTSHGKILMDSQEINRALPSVEKTLLIHSWTTELSAKIIFIENEIVRYKHTNTIDLDKIEENQETFLSRMDSIVGQYVNYSDKKLNDIIKLEIVLACLSIAIIFLEVRYIYYPQAQQLKVSFDTIEKKNKELEHFNFITSHDLQEPLRTVSNYIQILKEDYASVLDEDGNKFLSTIDNATIRMKALIRGLLDYSRLGKSKEMVPINCKKVLQESIGDLESLIQKANAIIEYPDDLPVVRGLELELRLLFQNLINNAIKFSKRDSIPKIQIGCRRIDNNWEFSVKDNGIGIEPESIDKIFTIFQRTEASRDYEGYGIGLANCKRIIELHNGKIWVKSEPGIGSTFFFSL